MSKNDPNVRNENKLKRPKPKGKCGHEAHYVRYVPARGSASMQLWCDTCGGAA